MPALYLDTSALVKLTRLEAETDALRTHLELHREHRRVTSELARTELLRALWGADESLRDRARALLGLMFQVPLTRPLLDQAGQLLPGVRLRSLDAIHLASAVSLGIELAAVLTYDARQRVAARALGIDAIAPGTTDS